MKRLIALLGLMFFVSTVGHAWLPKFIKDASEYQGAGSTLNIASGTIITFNCTTGNIATINATNFNVSTMTITYGLDVGSITIGANTLDTNEWAYLDGINQSVATTSDVSFEDVSISSLTVAYGITTTTAVFSGAVSVATLDTGQGANELYAMDQDVQATDDPTFRNLSVSSLTVTYGITIATGVIATSFQLNDNAELITGTDSDFVMGYDSGADEIRCTRGANVETDGAVAWRVTRSTIVCIGDAGTITSVTNSGDLYVEDKLEVDGNIYAGGGNLNIGAGNMKINDDYEFLVGTLNDFVFGYDSGADEVRIVRGTDVTDDAAVAWRVNRSTIVCIGDAGTINSALNSGDLYVEDRLEVDGTATFLNQTTQITSNRIWNYDDREMTYGTGYDYSVGYDSGADELRAVRYNDVTDDAAVAWRVTRSTVVCIGDGGTLDTIPSAGSGDLYVEDDIEVDGNIYAGGGTVNMGASTCRWNNDYTLTFGTLNDFGFGYSSGADELRCVRSSTLSTDANVAWRVTASTVVATGDAGTMTVAAVSGDFFAEGVIEAGSSIANYNRTTAQLTAIVPTVVGEQYFNSSTSKPNWSTGTAAGQFAESDGSNYDGS